MSTQLLQEKIVLGDEYDVELRKTLFEVLQKLGATEIEKSSGVAGSQEVQTFCAKVGAKSVLVEAETYIGLSLTGDPFLVREVAHRVRQRLPRLLPP